MVHHPREKEKKEEEEDSSPPAVVSVHLFARRKAGENGVPEKERLPPGCTGTPSACSSACGSPKLPRHS